jgi:hypothetical protein
MMTAYLKYLYAALLAAMLFTLTGCGYHIGFIRHPQLESLAVAPSVNETAIYNVASDMRMMMCEVVMQDGTFKLSDQSRADAILYTVVKSASFADTSDASMEDENTYSPAEWQVTVQVEYKLLIPGQGKALRTGTASGSARFQAPQDVEGSRLRATRQACYVAAQNIIYALAEGW